MTETVRSADGTTIGYERVGAGRPVILVGGAFSIRQAGYGLRELLAPRYTVYVFDRRGRGSSGDTAPYDVEREVEDVGALVEAAGGSAAIYGHSSGAILALEAAARGLPISKLAVYEPPYTFDPEHPEPAGDNGVQAALDAGDRDDAAARFMRLTGMDDRMIAETKQAPFWPAMVAIAHTLPYDLALSGDGTVPTGRFAGISAPTLVLDGGASPAWAARAATAVTDAIRGARPVTLDGQTHAVDPAVLAPVLAEFLG